MLLETKQLTKRFRNPGKGPGGVLAVSQANITLNPGETVGLFGDSGSGKSTLGLMLAGLLRPTSGEVLYRGEIPAFSQTQRRPLWHIWHSPPNTASRFGSSPRINTSPGAP